MLGVVLLFAGVLTVLPIVDASGLRDVTGVTTTSDKPPAADLQHVRVVPEESAEFSGSKVLGQLGAYYLVGEYSVQSENGKLVWVAPLDFQGPIQWLARGTSPGVIVVSAENPDAPAELRQRQPLRQSPDGGFVGELNISAPQSFSVIDPHRVRRGDQHVGRPVRA